MGRKKGRKETGKEKSEKYPLLRLFKKDCEPWDKRISEDDSSSDGLEIPGLSDESNSYEPSTQGSKQKLPCKSAKHPNMKELDILEVNRVEELQTFYVAQKGDRQGILFYKASPSSQAPNGVPGPGDIE